MNLGRTVCAQLISHPKRDREFRRCVSAHTTGITRWRKASPAGISSYRWLSPSLTYRESLRDIEACLRSAFRQALPAWDSASPVASLDTGRRTNRATWRIYADFAQVLIRIARPYRTPADPIGVDLDQTLYGSGLDHHRVRCAGCSLFAVGQVSWLSHIGC